MKDIKDLKYAAYYHFALCLLFGAGYVVFILGNSKWWMGAAVFVVYYVHPNNLDFFRRE